MKKWILGVFLFISSLTFAEAEYREILSTKLVFENGTGYFLMNDGSCFQAIPFQARWRGPIEWWNGVELAPGNYQTKLKDWLKGTTLSAFDKLTHLEVNLDNASNKKLLEQSTHLLYNERTGKVIFGIHIQPEDCLLSIYRNAKKEGFSKGYDKGRSEGYDEGYNANALALDKAAQYKLGYNEGYEAAVRDTAFSYDDGYEAGYNQAYQDLTSQ